MKRINHVVTPSERYIGIDLAAIVMPELRAPLAVLACAVALVALVWSAEHLRLDAAEREGDEYARQLAAVETGVARVRAVQRDVDALRSLNARVSEIRRSGAVHASEIAALGNAVPRDAWLSSVRADRTAISVEGGAGRLSTVAATLGGLARISSYSGARLLSVHDDPTTSGVTYAITMDVRP